MKKSQTIAIPQSASKPITKYAMKKLNKHFGIRGRNPISQIEKKLNIKITLKTDDARKRKAYRMLAEQYNTVVEIQNTEIDKKRKYERKNVEGLGFYKFKKIKVAFKTNKGKRYIKSLDVFSTAINTKKMEFEGQLSQTYIKQIMDLFEESDIDGVYLPNDNFAGNMDDVKEFAQSNQFKKYIQFKSAPKKKKQSKIKDAGAVDLDGFIKNDEWDTKTNKCVPDWIIYKYKDVKGFKKLCNYEKIQELSNVGGFEVEDVKPNENGYTLSHIKNFCNNVGISLYVMNEGELQIYQKPDKIYKNIPLVIEVKNNHLYPITCKKEIMRIRAVATSTLKYDADNFQQHPVKQQKEQKFVFNKDENISGFDFLNNTIKELNIQPYKARNLYISAGDIQHFIIDNITYVCSYNEVLHNYFGDEYVGQSPIYMLSPYIKDLPKSYFNKETRDALMVKGVKHRAHYGLLISDTEDENYINPDDEDVIKYDINKHYRYVMENPFDDFMTIGFNSLVEKCDVFDNQFGFYYVETDDLILLHQSNWYSNKILQKATELGIEFTVKYFIKADKSPVNLKDIISQIKDEIDDEDVVKLVINAISGMMGKTHTSNIRAYIDTDDNKIWDTFFKLRNVETAELYFKELDDYTLYGEQHKKELLANNLPIYLQILDWANIHLFNHIQSIGGELVARKTDAFWIRNPVNPPEITDEIGGIKLEEKTYIGDMSRDRHLHYEKPHYEWTENKDINDSSLYKDIIEILKEGNSIQLLGRAGVGKTYVLKQIKEHFGSKCVCLAFTNKATNNLEGQTIHNWLKMDKDGKLSQEWFNRIIQTKEVIIIDEISMITADLWKIFETIKLQSNITFVLAGDYRQLPPIEDECVNTDYFNHPVIRYLCDYQKVELTTIKRYDTELYEVSEKVWNGEDCDFVEEEFNYMKVVKADCNIVWSNWKRKIINKVCNRYYSKKASKHQLFEYDGEENKYNEDIILYAGCKLLVNQSVKSVGLRKNETLIVRDFDDEFIYFDDELKIEIDKLHSYFILGYAITTYKSQGDTYDGNINIFELEYLKTDKRFLYTAITRTTKLSNITFFQN